MRWSIRRASYAVSPKGERSTASPTEGPGKWQILKQGLSVKKYPSCYCTHRALDAMLDLLARRPVKPDDTNHEHVSISRRTPLSCATTRRKPDSRPSSAWSSPWRAAVVSRGAWGLAPLAGFQFVATQGRAGAHDEGNSRAGQTARTQKHPDAPPFLIWWSVATAATAAGLKAHRLRTSGR